jgi:hypothetical protein
MVKSIGSRWPPARMNCVRSRLFRILLGALGSTFSLCPS